MIHWLHGEHDLLPDTRLALAPGSDAPGLLAAGGDLTPERLGEAYAKGVFPWYSEGQPVLWWSPDPRMVLMVDEFRLSRSLRKTLARFVRSPGCELRIDSAFERVITACAATPREGQDGTWIVPEMVEAYCRWHDAGVPHSVETWVGGELVGGSFRTDRNDDIRPKKLNGTQVDFADYRAGVGLTYKMSENVSVDVGAGVSISRQFDFGRAGETYRTDPSPYVRLQMSAAF
jgi:hypothetical protein